MRPIYLSLFIILSGCGPISAQSSPLSPGSSYVENMNASNRNETAVLENLQPVINANFLAGRLYYEGVCNTAGETDIWFPVTRTKRGEGPSGLSSIHAVFLDPVIVDGPYKGVIKIVVGNVQRNILATPIERVNLSPDEQYNAILAIRAIEASSDVADAMHKLRIRKPISVLSYPMRKPAPGFPHLPAVLSSTTLDQALDEVARTFGGTVLYGACNRERRYYISYSPRDRFE